jgi:hypothetical protein
VEVTGEQAVEDPGADLQEQAGAAGGPAHLLLIDHALADHLAADSVSAAEIGSPARRRSPQSGCARCWRADAAAGLADRFGQLGLPGAERAAELTIAAIVIGYTGPRMSIRARNALYSALCL